MGISWTQEQRAAIEASGSDLLVSAAAGSGKTAVLVERIIEKILAPEHPVDIDRLLVVTFTNAAAAEMRERISAAIAAELEKNPDSEALTRQMTLVAKANIMTIHSFCLNTLRTNFDAAGVDPNFRVADTTENALLRLAALDEVLDEMYEDEEQGDRFAELLENYSTVKTRADFDQLIQKIYDFVMSLPNPEAWLQNVPEQLRCPEGEFSSSQLANKLLALAKDRLEGLLSRYEDLIEKADLDDGGEGAAMFLRLERETLRQLFSISDYSRACEWAESVHFATFPDKPKGSEPIYRDFILQARTAIKDAFRKKIAGELLLLRPAEQEYALRVQYPQMRCLSDIVRRLICRFRDKKKERNLLDFNDLEHFCYRLLTDSEGRPSELAKKISMRYEEILIDEYQDTSRLQEAIFTSIQKGKNLFMVGDLKQSIYRFRNTDPLLFRDKKERFSTEETASNRKIILSGNFRSRPEILDGINFLFQRIMSVSAGEIDYNDEELLRLGRPYELSPKPLPADLQLHIIEPGDSSGDDADADEPPPEAIEREANLAAEQIVSLLSGGYQIQTKEGCRAITYRDICILIRKTKGWAPVFMQTLSEWGIPCYCEAGGGFLQSAEVETAVALLKVIDNPYQDLPLLTVLRSQMFAFTSNELAQIRVADQKGTFYDAMKAKAEEDCALGKSVRSFLETLHSFRVQAQYRSLDELIWSVYQETGFYDAQSTLPGGVLRQSNLRLLAVRAKEYEKTSFRGLYSFIRFLDNYRAAGGDYDAARSIGEEQDIVRIMTIHKSKGLEFPVVILCGAGKQFNKKDTQQNILIHPELGYGPKFVDPELRITYPTAARLVIREQVKNELLSEEMRILYVALTRAREKLLIIGTHADVGSYAQSLGSSLGRSEKVPARMVLSASSYLDWFVSALLAHPACSVLRESVDSKIALCNETSAWTVTIHSDIPKKAAEEEQPPAAVSCEPDESGQLLRLVQFAYPFRSDETLPTKITVTELKNQRLREEEDPDSVFLYPRPKFLQENSRSGLTGAARGTAFHTVMQRIDPAKHAPDELDAQIASLVRQGYLTQPEADSVNRQQLRRFFASEPGRLMLESDCVEREVLFGIHIPASQAQPDYQGDAEIMLQGVIDCVMVKDRTLAVLDYKTEHVASERAVAEKYRIQLACYAHAAEKIYGLPVTRRYLYLFETGRTLLL